MTGGIALLLAATAAGPSIRDLSWMIGDWTFHDVATEAAGHKYEERGTRSCAWAMRDQYVRCESQGGTAARPRTYVTYVNYNAPQKRFEMLSMWSNHPPKVTQYGQLVDGELRFVSAAAETGDDGIAKHSWARMRPEGKAGWVWDSGTRPVGATDDGPVRYRDIAIRQPPR